MVEIGRIKSALLKHGTHRSYDELLLLKAYLAESEFVKNTLSAGLFPKQLDELCRSLLLETVERGDRVIRQNAVADRMFIVLSGSCEVKVKHKVDLAHGESEVREKTVFVCLPGTHFGERSLMNDEPRAASVYAKEPSDLIVITKLAYNTLLKGAVADSNAMAAKTEQPGTKAHLMKVLGKKREDRTKLEIEAVAGYLNWRIPFFRKFTPEQQLELCRVSEAVSIFGETVLFKQGTVGEAFYVILTGSVEVWVATQDEMAVMTTLAQNALAKGGSSSAAKNAGSVNPLKSGLGSKVAMLSVGDTFGERALENEDSLRMASIVTCDSQTDLLVISREDYYKLVSALTNSALMDKITLLRRTDMFRNTDATFLREMARYMVSARYDIDDYLFHAGTKATQMIIIEAGEVMVEVQVKTYSTTAAGNVITAIEEEREGGEEDSVLTGESEKDGAEVRARLHNDEIVELGRVAPNSVIAPYTTQAASPGERITHPESVRATTLVKAYTLGIHDFYSNMNKESKAEIVKIVAHHVRSSMPALWEQVPLRFGQKEWHQQVAWKKYKEYIRDKNKSLTYTEALKFYSNIFVTPDSGNVHQNRHGAISKVHVPDFISTMEKEGNALLTEEEMAYTADLGAHLLDDEASTFSVDSATVKRRQVTMSWGIKEKEKERETASKQLGIDITSTHPVVSKALASDAKREKQRLLDTIRGATAKSTTPAAVTTEDSLVSKRTLSTDGSLVANLKGGDGDDDVRRYAFSLIHFHQEVHSATPATIGVNRLLSVHLRHCGTMKSCDAAKRAADKQMQEALIILFGSDLSKADQLNLKWRSFTGFESVALDNPDIIVVYCRSVPVEYACINPERNLLDMPFPSFCKQKRQFFSCMRMKSIQMPKVVAPDVEVPRKKRRSKKKKPPKINEYGIEYADTDDEGSADEEEVISLDKRLQAEGLPATSKYKKDKFTLQMSHPFMLHELSSFAETLATSTTHGGSLKYGKTFEASQVKKDPLMVLTRASSLPADLFHDQHSVSQSRPGTKASEAPHSRGGPRRETSLLDANSAILSPKPNVEEKKEVEYICVLPLYQWIILEEDTIQKYDITQIPSSDSPTASARTTIMARDTVVPFGGGSVGPQTSDSPPMQQQLGGKASRDVETNSRLRRQTRLHGRDSVDTAFFEAGMTSMRDASTGKEDALPAVDPSVIRDLEKSLATKDLSKTIERFQAQEIEDEARAKEEKKLSLLLRRSSLATKSVGSVASAGVLGGLDQASVSSVGSASLDRRQSMVSRLGSKGGQQQSDTGSKGDDKTMDFVLTEEKGQALTEVMRERMRMIRMNDKLCKDEGKMKPSLAKRIKLRSNMESGESSEDEDESTWDRSIMTTGSGSDKSDAYAIPKQDYKRGVAYRGRASNSGAFEPGGMGLLGQRMDMYEALNHLPPSRSVVEKDLIRSKSLSALANKGKASKFGLGTSSLVDTDSQSVGSDSSSGRSSAKKSGSLAGNSIASASERPLSKNLATLRTINSLVDF